MLPNNKQPIKYNEYKIFKLAIYFCYFYCNFFNYLKAFENIKKLCVETNPSNIPYPYITNPPL